MALRIVLGAVGAWLISALVTTAWATLPFAFIVGVFPLTLWQILTQKLKTFHWFKVPSLDSDLPLGGLCGMTVWHEARLQEEGIENIANLATADLVDLLLSTKFPAARLVEWVDAAILIVCASVSHDKYDKLRKDLSIGTATELVAKLFGELGTSEGPAPKPAVFDADSLKGLKALAISVVNKPNYWLVSNYKNVGIHPKFNVYPEYSQPQQRERIALLGWGSLIWEHNKEFDDSHGPWHADGPALKLEFSRISETRSSALTLVIDPEHGSTNTVRYSLSKYTEKGASDKVIADLKLREGMSDEVYVGRAYLDGRQSHYRDHASYERIINWAKDKKNRCCDLDRPAQQFRRKDEPGFFR
jgi:hypothetical protein